MKKLPYYFLLPLFFSCSKPQIQQTSFKEPYIVLCKFDVRDVDDGYNIVYLKPNSIFEREGQSFFYSGLVSRDSVIRQFAAAWQTSIVLPSHHFGDNILKRFKSSKKLIRREHASAGLIVDMSFRIYESTNWLGKKMVEPYVSVNARIIDGAGKVTWKGYGFEQGKAVRKDRFGSGNDSIHFKDICGTDDAGILYQHALEKLMATVQNASLSSIIH